MPVIKIPETIVVPKQVMRDVLDRLAAEAPEDGDAGVLNGCKMHLFKSDLELSADTDKATLDAAKANFTDYAVSDEVVWGGALTDDDGHHSLTGSGKQFTAGDGATSNLIYGGYLVDSADAELICSFKFDAPVEVNEAGDGLIVIPIFPLSA